MNEYERKLSLGKRERREGRKKGCIREVLFSNLSFKQLFLKDWTSGQEGIRLKWMLKVEARESD